MYIPFSLSLSFQYNISSFYLFPKILHACKNEKLNHTDKKLLINDDTQRVAYDYVIVLLLSDKQDGWEGGEVITDYPLYILAMLCKLPNPLSKLPDWQVGGFRLPFASALTGTPTYVSVHSTRLYTHSQRS